MLAVHDIIMLMTLMHKVVVLTGKVAAKCGRMRKEHEQVRFHNDARG